MKQMRTVLAEIIELPIPENDHPAIARALAETLDSHVFDGMAEASPHDLSPTLTDAQKLLNDLETQVNKVLLPALRRYHFEQSESVWDWGIKKSSS